MMRKFLPLILSLVMAKTGFAQINFNYLQTDSLRHELSNAKQDTSRVLLMSGLAEAYRWSNSDSAMYYGQKALALANKINFKRGEANALLGLSVVQRELGNLAKALDFATKALSIAQGHFSGEEITALLRVGNVYSASKDYNKALIYLHQAENRSNQAGNDLYTNISRWLIALAFEQKNDLDSALYYANVALKNLSWDAGVSYAYNILGDIQLKLKKDSLALHSYWLGLKDASRTKDYRTAANLNISLANYYKSHNQIDSAIYYGKEGLAVAQLLSYKNRIISSSSILAEIYEAKDPKEALKYYKIFNAAKDSLYGADKMLALQTLMIDEQEKQKEAEATQLAYQNRIKQYGLLGGLLAVLVILLLLYRNNRRKQKANELLEKQKKKIEAQRVEAKIETALEKVRAVAMSMKSREDMLDVCRTISEQLTSLGVQEIRNVQTAIFYESKGTYMNYEYYAKHNKTLVTETSYTNHEIHQAFANQMLKGKGESYSTLIPASELPAWITYQKTTNVFIDHFLETAPSLNYYWHSLGVVALGISTYAPLRQDEMNLFKRFLKVFELSFTRYLDIEKAETQAREAQIEAGLERVRAAANAMHKSKELLNVISVLCDQLLHLGFNIDSANFNTSYREKDWNLWLYNPGFPMYADKIHIPYFDHPYFNRTLEALENGSDFNAFVFGKEDKDRFLDYIYNNTIVKHTSNERKQFTYSKPGFAWSAVYLKNTAVTIANYDAKPYTEEQNAILRRFGAVFEQSYTRFLDLQKAEAQAREAQIELGLERVRARAMGMQNSEELKELIGTVFIELTKLDLALTRCVIMIFDPRTNGSTWWMANSEAPSNPIGLFVQYHEYHPYLAYIKGLQEQQLKWTYSLEGKIKKQWDDFLFTETELSHLPDFVIAGMKAPDQVYLNASFNSFGNLTLATLEPLSDAHFDIMLRFAKVFDLTYTRFNDLKNAEALARESQIQLALERVRARTMAMQSSDELAETAAVVFKQLIQLGIEPNRLYIGIINDESGDLEFWITDEDGNKVSKRYVVNIHKNISIKKMYEAWKEKKNSLTIDMKGQELKSWVDYWHKEFGVPFKEGAGHERRLQNLAYFSKGFIATTSFGDAPPETLSLLDRFAAVFNLTYTRFSDLQQAEAQAKESQIQLALERVRARTMAMQHSDELKSAATLLFQQAKALGVPAYSCGYNIWEEDELEFTSWMSTQDGTDINAVPNISLTEDANFIRFAESRKNDEPFFVLELRGDRMQEHYKYLKTIPEFKVYFDYAVSVGFPLPETQIHHIANFSHGNLLFITLEPCPEFHDVFKRFAQVFDQTYTRFLDLQKAEAQARESQIQLALERVRARTMAMQKSEELAETAEVLYHQLKELGDNPERITIGLLNESTGAITWWATDQQGTQLNFKFEATIDEPTVMLKLYNAWKANNRSLVIDLTGIELSDWVRYCREVIGVPIKEELLKNRRVQTAGFFSHGWVMITSPQLPTPETINILERFASVFNLTYRRFLDLQKAEEQTREANIEAALERVRGKAMAMHNSNDLSVTASMVFTELRKLGIKPIRCGVGLLNKESRKAQLYSAASSAGGDSLALIGWVLLSGHPVLEKIYETWLTNEDYFPELSGEQLRSYYELLLAGLPVTVPETKEEQKQYGHFFPFSVGCLYAWSETPYNENEIKILKRFAAIVDLTFRRYLELQTSEANTREAIKQAALNRIRADIASMRTVNDLDRITPLIWNELTILGVPFIRCGVFIMDDEQQLIHTFLSTPDGKAIAAFHISYNTPGNIKYVINHWRENKNYIDHWNEDAFTEFAQMLETQGALTSSKQYLKTIPQGGFYLHFLPFLQGMLYVGNTNQLGEEEIKLIQSIADAFSTAYARYEDFNKLEAAKKQVDKTLVELKQTQQQLIQSEKMASLGELTAGIAHEIQNPLNFVNNFSEVSTELLDEINSELSHGDISEAKAIVNDVKQNLEKITHHGKRADAIVKSMLQHSRKSAGQKDLVDINSLVDEYLRMSYHGFRAKDKSFNAILETHFDPEIKRANIIGQDIGRVLLNLFNNAFYAVNEKKKEEQNGFAPTVQVTTFRRDGGIEIKVKDNGKGIPEKVLEKIYQPFFTTKPTGEGTGLGLSLSYDIITKGHGGELKVETVEGQGSEFIIQLPNLSSL